MVDQLSFAIVCSSNQNRSMEAHHFMSKRGFRVRSFGSGNQVKLPGTAPDKPNIYDFTTTYEEMYRDLVKKDKHAYTQNGLLNMLDRNRRLKSCPERFQACPDKFNVIVTCEERVYEQVVEDLETRDKEDITGDPVHIFNIDITDNHEDALIGAILICNLCSKLQDAQDMEDEIDELIQEFEHDNRRTILNTVAFY